MGEGRRGLRKSHQCRPPALPPQNPSDRLCQRRDLNTREPFSWVRLSLPPKPPSSSSPPTTYAVNTSCPKLVTRQTRCPQAQLLSQHPNTVVTGVNGVDTKRYTVPLPIANARSGRPPFATRHTSTPLTNQLKVAETIKGYLGT